MIKKDLTLKFSRIFVKIKYSSERFPDYLDFYNLLSLEGKGFRFHFHLVLRRGMGVYPGLLPGNHCWTMRRKMLIILMPIWQTSLSVRDLLPSIPWTVNIFLARGEMLDSLRRKIKKLGKNKKIKAITLC